MKKSPNIQYFICGHSIDSYLLRRYIYLNSEGLSGTIIGTGINQIVQLLWD